MLTLSVLWVVLAGAVTVMAMLRRSRSPLPEGTPVQAEESGQGFAVLAVVSCLVLLVGFLYVGRFLVSGL